MGYNDGLRQVAETLPIKVGKILVTGATGLIGSCCIDALLYANEYCGCRFKIFALGRSQEKISKRFKGKVTPVVQDVVMPLTLDVVFDYIIHAASNADPKMYALQPAETIITNVIGTKNVLEYCKKNIDTRLLLTSTFEVYGKIDGIDVYSENMVGLVDFHMLRNGYTESKRCAEMLVNSYIDEYGIDAVICRLASIYGPTMLLNDSKAHAQFIRNELHGENIALKSKGEQRRTYCYVLDAVSALFMVLSKGEIGEAYNIANENSVASIADVASCCAKIVGTKVVFDIPDTVESKGFSKPQNCILDNKKLKSLGWEGRYSLEEGFTETIDELRKNERRGQKSLCLNN